MLTRERTKYRKLSRERTMYRKDERMIKEGLQEKGLMYEDRERRMFKG